MSGSCKADLGGPPAQLLRAVVGFAGCSLPSYDRALSALRTWSSDGTDQLPNALPGYSLGAGATSCETGLKGSRTPFSSKSRRRRTSSSQSSHSQQALRASALAFSSAICTAAIFCASQEPQSASSSSYTTPSLGQA